MIQTKNLTTIFITEDIQTKALNDINLHVKDGEFIAIMGPSGCGKSTLLNILGLIDIPSDGSYMFHGKEIGNLKEKELTKARKGNIGFIFQSFNLIDGLTVYENVELPLTFMNINQRERKEKVYFLLVVSLEVPP